MAVSPRKRTRIQLGLLQRREMVARRVLEGLTYREVAEELGVALGTIAADVEANRELWRTRAAGAHEDHRAVEIAKLDRLEAEAWNAWHRSKEDAVTKLTRTETGLGLESTISIEETEVNTSKGKKKVKVPTTLKGPSSILAPLKEVFETRRVGQVGDPRFLEVVHNCQKARAKILGVLDERSVNVNTATSAVSMSWDQLLVQSGGPAKLDEVEERLRREAAIPVAAISTEAPKES